MSGKFVNAKVERFSLLWKWYTPQTNHYGNIFAKVWHNGKKIETEEKLFYLHFINYKNFYCCSFWLGTSINDVTSILWLSFIQGKIHKTSYANYIIRFFVTLGLKILRLLRLLVLFEADIIKGWFYLEYKLLSTYFLWITTP